MPDSTPLSYRPALRKPWRTVALTLPRNVRVYLTGRLALQVDERLVDQGDFVGQQGRAAFAYLTLERSRPVSRAELASVLWSDAPPVAFDVALNAVVSKLRGVLTAAGFPDSVLKSASGCYELRLPASTWVDLEAAADAIHEAETALQRDDPAHAYGPSAVAHHIARRPFLAGDESQWAESRRQKLRNILIRALECRSQVYLWNNEFALAVEAAREAVYLEPFRETGHQHLMRAHAGSGNTAEALQAYERCRKLIAEELGVDPSPATKALHMMLLKSV
jgi:DNA-binding SARP family transcriptional activator